VNIFRERLTNRKLFRRVDETHQDQSAGNLRRRQKRSLPESDQEKTKLRKGQLPGNQCSLLFISAASAVAA
jgi:hypothetical protein